MDSEDGSFTGRHRRTASEESGMLGTSLSVSCVPYYVSWSLTRTDKAYRSFR